MRGRSMLPRRESSSSNKVDLLILIVMVALFLLTMTITFSPANFPSREYEDMNPVIPHLVGVDDEDTTAQDAVDRQRKAEAEVRAREEANRRAEEEEAKKRRQQQQEDEEQRRRQQQEEEDKEQRRKEAEERQKADEEQRRQAAEEKSKQEEQQKADEEQRRQAAEEKKKQEEQQRADEEQRRQAAEDAKKEKEEEMEQDPERVAFLKQKAQEIEEDKQNYAARRTLMSKAPQMLGDEWENEEEEQCSQEDCPWKGAYLLGKDFRAEKAGCDPRSRQCKCLEHWGGKQCPESFPKEKQLTIAASGWILDFMGLYVEGQYSCPHSAPRVVNFKTMTADDNPDIYLSADVPFVKQVWEEMLQTKHTKNKPNSKTALLYIEAEPHVGHWFTSLPELDISLTFYNWADIHVSHIQDHPSWFRNSPYPFHQKRNITFINTGCYGHRTAVVEEFMKYVHVENLGACLKNADYCELFPYCCRTPFHGSYTSRYVEKECLIHHYKFVLALENNAVTYNYTTEKFWQPMKMGTVPVYWGNNSSKILVPGDNTVIRVDDFPTIKDAAMYLKELIEDEDKYNKHLEWKWKPFRKEFLVEADHALSTFVCRLADAYKKGQTFYGAEKMPGYAEAKAIELAKAANEKAREAKKKEAKQA